jgi:hypothetical protein
MLYPNISIRLADYLHPSYANIPMSKNDSTTENEKADDDEDVVMGSSVDGS